MHTRLLISVLVLALSGANSGAASICGAYCMSSASVGSTAVHHHQTESQPNSASISHHIHTRHHGPDCAECPPTSENSLNQKTDCASLGQVQALKEGSFSLDAPRGVAQFDVADTPADALALSGGGERFIPFDASHIIRNSNPASVSLRI